MKAAPYKAAFVLLMGLRSEHVCMFSGWRKIHLKTVITPLAAGF
jgi:hypothetical protein